MSFDARGIFNHITGGPSTATFVGLSRIITSFIMRESGKWHSVKTDPGSGTAFPIDYEFSVRSWVSRSRKFTEMRFCLHSSYTAKIWPLRSNGIKSF